MHRRYEFEILTRSQRQIHFELLRLPNIERSHMPKQFGFVFLGAALAPLGYHIVESYDFIFTSKFHGGDNFQKII